MKLINYNKIQNEKLISQIILITILLFICFITIFIFSACKHTDANVEISQVNEEQKILVDFSKENDIKQVQIIVKHGNEEVSNTVITDTDELAKKSCEVYAYYGKQKVYVAIEKENGDMFEKSIEIGLSANEYNIAPLSGSLPVLLFTLSLFKDDGLNNKPTFVWLDRAGAWNWDKLPNNVYPIPTATKSEYTTPNVNRDLMYSKTNAYIRELASINEKSKFNLYLNDYDTDQFLHMIVASGILNRSTCTYFSDGAFSYSEINNTFNVENATQKFQEMAEKYNKTKSQVINKGYYSWDSGFEVNGNELRPYLLVIAHEEENVNYVFPRLRSEHILIDKDTTNFVKNYIIDTTNSKTYGKGIEERDINGMLKLIQTNNEKVTELKNLYKFNDDMFSEAYENDKKVMMLLGTYAFSEPDFADYTNLTKLLYGDDFVYYYKGHPNTPTDMYPEKAQELNDLELYDIESTINAELILFYFPNIYMSGYSSSTFNSLQNEEMACVFWNSTKENALNISGQNAEMFDYYVSKLSLDDENYGSLLQQSDCKYYLIEINDLLDVNYSFAIYNATLNVLNYYDSNKQLISN